jgi:iron complex transport system ATP-binding protein
VNAALSLRGISVRFNGSRILDSVDLDIAPGEWVGIIGPNGAGKTTLLKVLAREIYPSGGTVKIYGKDRWNVWELRKHLGIVSADLQQNYAAHAHGSAVVRSGFYASIDTFGHQTFTQDQTETASRLARELEIEHLSETPFSQMSTGEQRRHLLARALVHDPETLVLDEPTTGLDLTAQFQYLETVRELMKSGKTLILVTHHIHEIPPEIDEIVLIKNGVVVLKEKKDNAMTDQNLSELFDVPVKVVSNNGFYHVAPA